MAENLVGISVYNSSKYSRKILGHTSGESDLGCFSVKTHYSKTNEDFIKWLEKNAIYKLTEAIPKHFHSDISYVLNGKNGVICTIYPEFVALKEGYKWKVTIRHQPADKEVPSELEEALLEHGFKPRKSNKK